MVRLSVCPKEATYPDVLRIPAAFPEAHTVYVSRDKPSLMVQLEVPTPRGRMIVTWSLDRPNTFKVVPCFGRGRGEKDVGHKLWRELYLERFFSVLRGDE